MVITLRGGGMGVSTCKTNDKQFLINVLNLQREYSQGNQIKTYLFERLKTENIAACINQTKIYCRLKRKNGLLGQSQKLSPEKV